MARIDSLNVLLSTTGNDYLAEQYGAVIDIFRKQPFQQQSRTQHFLAIQRQAQ